MPLSTSPRLHAFLTSHAAVFLLYALVTLPFVLLQDLTILHCDDWGFLNDMRLGMSPYPDVMNSRVLFSTFWWLMYVVSGDTLQGAYLLIRASQVFLAFSVATGLHRLRVLPRPLTILAGLLVLLPSGDHSREWWTMAHPWFATGFGFGFFLLMIAAYICDHRSSRLLYAGIAVLLSFGLFEIHLGLVILVLGVLILRVHRRIPMALLILVGAVGVYMLLHTWQGLSLDVRDDRIRAMGADLPVLFARSVKGLSLIVKSWGAPLHYRSSLSTGFSSATVLAACFLSMAIAWTALHLRREVGATETDANKGSFRTGLSGIGMLMIALAAAFLPIILVMPPSGNDIDSRTLMLAAPVANLLLLFVAHAIAGRFSGRSRATTIITWAGMVPLLASGIVGNLDRLVEHRREWVEEKQMLRAVLVDAPDLRDSTHVVLLLDHDDLTARLSSARPMFGATFHTLNGALQLLYDDTTISGGLLSTVRFSDRPLQTSALRGPLAHALGWPLPLARSLVWAYDVRTGNLHVLSRQELEKRWGLALPAYNPYTRIDTNGVNRSPWRSLIE